ncbi:hypothetical protein za3_10 [Zamilon virus]|uniref:Putative transposase n=1 Tax=Zamilon virus TaxID=1411887 RepID=A0A2P1EHI8_9VIRU|nr:putative transposase [Zamilon virus]
MSVLENLRYRRNKILYEKAESYYLKGGLTVVQACKKAGISKPIFYKTRKMMKEELNGTTKKISKSRDESSESEESDNESDEEVESEESDNESDEEVESEESDNESDEEVESETEIEPVKSKSKRGKKMVKKTPKIVKSKKEVIFDVSDESDNESDDDNQSSGNYNTDENELNEADDYNDNVDDLLDDDNEQHGGSMFMSITENEPKKHHKRPKLYNNDNLISTLKKKNNLKEMVDFFINDNDK